MQEVITQVQAAGRGMWKYRWIGVSVAWSVALVGTIVVFRIPDQYEASARIHVDTLSILKPLMAGLAVQPDVNQQVAMLSRTLISRPNVEKLVRMADLDLKNQSKAQQDATIDELMKTLRIAGTGRDNLYLLTYRDTEADRAKRAIQSLVSIFVESGLGATRNDAASAKAFINDQIKSYQAKLEEAEARLKDFRLRNVDIQFAEGRDAASRLGELSAQLEKARLELREAENARDAAKAALSGERTPGSNLSTQSLLQESAISVATPEIDARLDAQRRQLDNLLQRFTEQHPDVLSARRLVADLEEQRRKEVQALRKAAMAVPPSMIVNAGGGSSLAAQELNRMLAISEVQVAALGARVAEYAARYNQARASLRTAPQLEAEAAQLNRDYAIHKKNYEDLVARRESAAMSGDLDVASGMADFRLIDPPRVSPKPVSPNRLLLLPLVLLIALAAGLFAAFAGSQMRPVFFHPGELRGKFELPILGMVSAVVSDADVRRRRVDRLRFGAASGGLVLLLLAGLTAMSLLASR
jgi:polysaccharide chain length determinant protein (PEP-CTERM system associated)